MSEELPEIPGSEPTSSGERPSRSEGRIRRLGRAALGRFTRRNPDTGEIVEVPSEPAVEMVDGIPSEEEPEDADGLLAADEEEPPVADELEPISDEETEPEDTETSTEPRGTELPKDFEELELSNEEKAKLLELLNSGKDARLERFLKITGVPEDKVEAVAASLKAGPIRLTMSRLRELGLNEEKADEAHRILVEEKGRMRVKHITALGFGADKAEEVHELLKSNPVKLTQERLAAMGLDHKKIDEIMSTDDDEKILRGILSGGGFSEEVIRTVLKVEEQGRKAEERSEVLGYKDQELLDQAKELGISDKAMKRALGLHFSLEVLIKASETREIRTATGEARRELVDEFMNRDLVERYGIELPGYKPAEDSQQEITTAERRKAERDAANVYSIYPRGLPHRIPASENEYFVQMINTNAGRLRNSLIPAGGLPFPESLYHTPGLRTGIDILNWFYLPIGRRLLAGRVYRDRRHRKPHEDYGAFGQGREARREELEHIININRKIKLARRQLSWSYRHILNNPTRSVAKIDLGQLISEVRRDQQAFEMGRASLPSEREQYRELRGMVLADLDAITIEKERLQLQVAREAANRRGDRRAREQLQPKFADLSVRSRENRRLKAEWDTMEDYEKEQLRQKFNDWEEKFRPKWTKDELGKLQKMASRSPEQQERMDYLLTLPGSS